jgi:hypothetical protein
MTMEQANDKAHWMLTCSMPASWMMRINSRGNEELTPKAAKLQNYLKMALIEAYKAGLASK